MTPSLEKEHILLVMRSRSNTCSAKMELASLYFCWVFQSLPQVWSAFAYCVRVLQRNRTNSEIYRNI